MKKRLVCVFLAAFMLAGAFPATALATGPTNYTYIYNEWGVPIPSPDAYRSTEFILGQHLYFEMDLYSDPEYDYNEDGELVLITPSFRFGRVNRSIGAWREPQDLHVWRDNESGTFLLYVADSGNNRIVVLEFSGENYADFEVIDVVTHVTMPDGSSSAFHNPHGIYVSPWAANLGERWIADTWNNRVLHVDTDWNVLTEIYHPGIYGRYPGSDELEIRAGYGLSLLGEYSDFLPQKVAVDFSGRIFVQTQGVNRGLMEFDRDGVFAGYMGAPPVTIGIWDQFWRLIATQEQRERMQLFVPVEYNNVTIDHEGFLFVTTASPDVEPVARLNAMGDDVMIRNGFEYPIGDLWWGMGGGRSGPSELIDVTALPNGIFVVFDRNRGRLFAYDTQGQLLYAWGGPTTISREGFFTSPTALDSMNYTLFALDGGIGDSFAAITRFDLTEYGALINYALDMYHRGLYEESYAIWNEVLRMNGNFGLAYIGLARALLRQGYYREAMRYFRLQNDARNFGRAFGFYRRIWMEEYFWMFAVGVGVLMVIPPVVKKVIKVRREIKES